MAAKMSLVVPTRALLAILIISASTAPATASPRLRRLDGAPSQSPTYSPTTWDDSVSTTAATASSATTAAASGAEDEDGAVAAAATTPADDVGGKTSTPSASSITSVSSHPNIEVNATTPSTAAATVASESSDAAAATTSNKTTAHTSTQTLASTPSKNHSMTVATVSSNSLTNDEAKNSTGASAASTSSTSPSTAASDHATTESPNREPGQTNTLDETTNATKENATNDDAPNNYNGMDDDDADTFTEYYDDTDNRTDYYGDDDVTNNEAWSSWNDHSPTAHPTPRPTHVAYSSPTDDVLADGGSNAVGEFDDDYKTPEKKIQTYLNGVETPQEMEKDRNVQIVAGVLSAVFVVLWLATAHQTMENPDGLCASFCRLTLKFICCITRVLFLPCRYLCCKSNQPMNRRGHAPMRAPFPSDLELT